jgi:hypothetical protein
VLEAQSLAHAPSTVLLPEVAVAPSLAAVDAPEDAATSLESEEAETLEDQGCCCPQTNHGWLRPSPEQLENQGTEETAGACFVERKQEHRFHESRLTPCLTRKSLAVLRMPRTEAHFPCFDSIPAWSAHGAGGPAWFVLV